MKKIQVEGVKDILSWCNNPEDGAIAQASNLSRLPFLVGHVALMPDTHQGYGMPIGGVIACHGVVIPNAVGVDIGCGMCAVESSSESIDIDILKAILGDIRKAVPVGFGHNATAQLGMPERNCAMHVVDEQYESATKQLGTLGGGNHFIEIQRSKTRVWVMLHSGSRNIGLKVAKYYNIVADELNRKWHSTVPEEHELAFLPLDSEQGKAYLSEMEYCLRFALANRQLMLARIIDIMTKHTGCSFGQVINIHHNYARLESHFGRNVMTHRKGATSARAGEMGIIPGSQGTASYIVRGKGNKASMESCSHGAGRRMGRKEACRVLNLATEQKRLDDLGILHAVRGKDDLEEAAGAYKDIATVMEEQSDLVEIVEELHPLAVVKG